MSGLPRIIRFRAYHGAFPTLILAGLTLILAACTNAGGGGPGY